MNAPTDPIVSAVESLERCLAEQTDGRDARWAERLDRSLAGVRQAVRTRDATLTDGEGKLVDVDRPLLPSPTMDRLAGELRGELDGILAEVASLRSDVREERGGFGPRLDALRGRVARLLESLRRYEHDETAAVQQAVNTDIGAGD